MGKDEPIANRKAFFPSLPRPSDLEGSKAGISPVFLNLSEAGIRHIESLATATPPIGGGRVLRAFLPRASICFASKGFRHVYGPPPELLGLLEEDEREKADYYKTLKTYLHCFLDQTEAATQLSIHRNTLLYRLRRIEQKLSADLSSNKDCLKYLTAIQMLGK